MLEFRNLTTGTPVNRLPDMDVHEENGELILRAEVPGLHLGEIELSRDRDDLIIDADGWDDSAIGREHYEHVHGRLPLPFWADFSGLSGRVEDGVLEVHIPLPALESWRPGEEIVY